MSTTVEDATPLLSWCNDRMRQYKGVKTPIRDFGRDSWSNGLAIVALLHSTRGGGPLAIGGKSWDEVVRMTPAEVATFALDQAAELGVRQAQDLRPEDVLGSTPLASRPAEYARAMRALVEQIRERSSTVTSFPLPRLSSEPLTPTPISDKRRTASPPDLLTTGRAVSPAVSPGVDPKLQLLDRDFDRAVAKSQVVHSDQQVEDAKAATKESLQRLHAVDSELKQIDQKLRQARSDTDRSQAQLQERKQRALRELQLEKAKHEKEMADIQRQIDEAQRAGRGETAMHKELRKRLEREKAEHDKAEAAMKDIMSELADIRKRLASEAMIKAELERQRAEKEREREQLQKRHDATMGRLKQMLDDAIEAEKKFGGQAEVAKIELVDKQRTRDAAASAVRMTKLTIESEESRISQLALESDKAEKDAARAKVNKDLEETMKQEKLRELREAQKRKKKARAALNIAITDRDYQAKLRDMTLEDVNELELELEAEIRRTSAMSKAATDLKRAQAEIAERIEEQHELADDVVAMTEQRRTEAIETLKSRFESAKARAAELQKSLAGTRDGARDQKERLEAEVKEHDERAAKMAVDGQRVSRQIEADRQDLTKASEAERMLTETMKNAEKILDDTGAKVRAANSRLRKHNAEKAKAEKSLKDGRQEKLATDQRREQAAGTLDAARDRHSVSVAEKKRQMAELTAAQDTAAELAEAVADAQYDVEREVAAAQAEAVAEVSAAEAALRKAEKRVEREAAMASKDALELTKKISEARDAADRAEHEREVAEKEAAEIRAQAELASRKAASLTAAADTAEAQQEAVTAELQEQQRKLAAAEQASKKAAEKAKAAKQKLSSEVLEAGGAAAAALERADAEKRLELARMEADQALRRKKRDAQDAESRRREEVAGEDDETEREMMEEEARAEREHKMKLEELKRQKEAEQRAIERKIREAESQHEDRERELLREQEDRLRAARASKK